MMAVVMLDFVYNICIICEMQAEIGIVYNPITEELFTAKAGQGAFCNGTKLQVTSLEGIHMVPTVRESQGKSRRSGEVREFKSTMVQKLTKMQKKTELLHAHSIQQFKIFSARFARRLFMLLLFHLFCRHCF